jgi:DNA-binding HxlR family transcriptional regulator
VHREDHHTNPPHVEYSLTPAGRRVADQVIELARTLESVMPEVMSARRA